MIREESNLAVLFPGQGSQSVGMLAELADLHPCVHAVFADASDVLGYDLWDIVKNGPEEQLNSTRYTQPAMLAAGVAIWRVWCEQTETRVSWMAGHSLGEYTALVASGSLDFRDGIRLVAERARLMQEAVPSDVGAMAAVLGLGDAEVLTVCAEASRGESLVSAANFNAPGQVVVAGHREAVARAVDLAKASGAKRAVVLPVSVPSHCPLMKHAAEEFRKVIKAVPITPSGVKVVHNVDVKFQSDEGFIREALVQQLYGSVRWADTIRYLAENGVDHFVEMGPGRVLAGLNRRIVPDAQTEAVYDASSLAKARGFIV